MRAVAVAVLLVSTGCFPDPPVADASTTSASTSANPTGSTNPSTTVDPSTSSGATTIDSAVTGPDPATTSPPETTTGPPSTGTTTGGGDPCSNGAPIAYINFGGASLATALADNAPGNLTEYPDLAGDWPVYAAGDDDEVFDAVVEHWRDFDFCLTMDLPDAPAYDMIVVQSEPHPFGPNVLSLIEPDCGNAGSNNLDVLFLADENGLSAQTKANAISKFLARLFGVDSVDAPEDLMHEFLANTMDGATFTDACQPLSPGAICPVTPPCAAAQQNSHAYLSDLFVP